MLSYPMSQVVVEFQYPVGKPDVAMMERLLDEITDTKPLNRWLKLWA